MKILFQAHGRRGLGHLMRGVNIARAVRASAPSAEILFYTRSGLAQALCGEEFRYVLETETEGAGHWSTVLETFAPDIVIYDTVLPKGAARAATAPCRVVYIMRKAKEARQHEIFAHPFLGQVDRVLIPHSAEEFGYALPPSLAAKSRFVGPIIRMADATIQERLRERYGIRAGDFLVTSTVGGGGFQEQATAFFARVFAAHRRLQAEVPNLRHLVIRGPHFASTLAPLDGMTIAESEPELVNLLAISDLVIAEGGYNTVNEIRLNKVPAVFLPSARNIDDQEERVRALEAQGLALVFSDDATTEAVADGIAALATSPVGLRAMRERYAGDRLVIGNRVAAEQIVGLV